MKITIGDYLLKRLKELGIRHVIGVPGDYNLGFLDQIVNYEGLQWIGTCNELNGAYAADGYARINGASCMVTTFGVGELSAINGVGGSYAEYVPVIKIVGMPSLSTQERKAIVHHTLGGGDFNVFADMYSKVTESQALLTKFNAASEIDRVIRDCFIKKRPVYIGIPSDITYHEIEVEDKPLDLSYPKSNPDAIQEAVERVAKLIENSKCPVILADICAIRHSMKPYIDALIDKTGIHFATMNMGKGIINESHPLFIGNYNGDFSTEGVQKRVESSDCIISIGTVLSDFNTGGFTAKLNVNVTLEIHSNYVQIKHSVYPDLYFVDFFPNLTTRLSKTEFSTKVEKSQSPPYTPREIPITQVRFWQRISDYLEKNCVVIAETGTSMFGSLPMPIPDDTKFIAQTLWGSIGYSVGATLGTCLAAPDRQTLLFVGDGSFQLTGQEVSTMIRQRLKPIIFLINNDGYTIERVIHGPTMIYNDIQMWDYVNLPKIFGNDIIWTTKVSNELELEAALEETKKHPEKLRFIEVIMDRDDSPEILKRIGKACAEANKYG
ncbi:MAG: Indole-3-pyruvate decarboxylase [Chlamydiae bacterium]|nr:Indole-3-pyruvate decarboxylase [Chlamydiota bacterium]